MSEEKESRLLDQQEDDQPQSHDLTTTDTISGPDEQLDPDVDAVLDDALQGFFAPSVQQGTASGDQVMQDDRSAWSESFIREATQNFESILRARLQQQQSAAAIAPHLSSGPMGLSSEPQSDFAQLDSRGLAASFESIARAAVSTAEGSQCSADFSKCLSDTLQQMSKNNAEVQAPPTADELSNMFQNLGVGSGGDTSPGELFSLMESMIENVLSKDVLYPPVKEIVDKYPDWLADKRESLSEEDYSRYNKQYEIMRQVVHLFESESDSDTEEVKKRRFQGIFQQMQLLPEFGHPPSDLIGDVGQLITFDETGAPVFPDMSAIFGNSHSTGSQQVGAQQQQSAHPQAPLPPQGDEQCIIM